MTASAPARLQRDWERLRRDLDRYRTATDAGLDALDDAIGWLDRNRRAGLARDLRRNREAILQALREDARR